MKLKIKCPICYKNFSQLTIQHLKTHKINTFEDFRKQFPNTTYISDYVKHQAKQGAIKGKPLYEQAIKRKREENHQIYYSNPKICPTCSNIISYDKKYNQFCSNKCIPNETHSRGPRTEKEKDHLRKINKGQGKGTIWIYKGKKNKRIKKTEKIPKGWKKGLYTKNSILNPTTPCIVCKNEISKKNKSKMCFKCFQQSDSANENRGKTFSKTRGYYIMWDNSKFYYMSSFELRFLKNCNKYKIKITKPKPIKYFDSNRKMHNYFPDFQIKNIVYEIKGYETAEDKNKISTAKLLLGSNYRVLKLKDIELFENTGIL